MAAPLCLLLNRQSLIRLFSNIRHRPEGQSYALSQLCFSLKRYGSMGASGETEGPSIGTCPSATNGSVGNAGAGRAQKISKAMIAYLERAESHNAFMSNEIREFEIGKRHLANIMGANPDEFTQDDIDAAIEYLLPSGLFDKKARPKLKHPSEGLPKRKAAQFGQDGRPYHSFFYTGKPNYVDVMHKLSWILESLKAKDLPGKVALEKQPEKLQLAGSDWLDKKSMEAKLQESLADPEYQSLINMLEFICTQRFAIEQTDLIFTYRSTHQLKSTQQEITPTKEDETGRMYQEAVGWRRDIKAVVRLYKDGKGRYIVNGRELLEYFPDLYHRKEIMFPLHFTDMLSKVDFDVVVGEGGATGQAGAVRHAVSLALQSFVNKDMLERMRIAGLLTRDPRRRERKKYGQAGARRKYTWKKR